MLTVEETSNLLAQAQTGDDVAKEQLITMNSPLIKSIVKRYLNKGVEFDDLYQLGAMGFVKAINNYDPTYNVKFTTYAVPMIAGEIKRFLRDDGSVKVSRSLKHLSGEIKKFVNNYVAEFNANPHIETISKALNIEANDVVFALESNLAPISINDKSTTDENQTTLADRIKDNFNVENFVDKLALRESLEELNAREKKVIIMRYYLDKTQAEIAKELGVSQVQVSRIENKVLSELKSKLNV